MKHYYLYFHPYTYISLTKDEYLIFNTLTSQYLHEKGCHLLHSILERLYQENILYVIPISEEDLSNSVVSEFCKWIIEFHCGYVKETHEKAILPIQITPTLKLNYDFIRQDPYVISSGISNYISDVYIFPNSDLIQQNNSIHRQLGFPDLWKSQYLLDIPNKYFVVIRNLLKGCKDFKSIHFLFECNISDYNIEIINTLVIPASKTINIYIRPQQINSINVEKILINFKNLNINILIKEDSDIISYEKRRVILCSHGCKFDVFVIIQNHKQFNNYLYLKSKYYDDNINVRFLHNYTNSEFIKECLFIDLAEIVKRKISINDIFINSKMNSLNFGKIFIDNRLNVYTSVIDSPIGNIHSDNLKAIIQKEMLGNTSWLLTRNHVLPCKFCLFKELCPPISNVEKSIDIYNLCNVKGYKMSNRVENV